MTSAAEPTSPVVRRSATCRSRVCVRCTTVLAMYAPLVFAAVGWTSASPPSSQQSAVPIAEATSHTRIRDARVGDAGRSASMFGPTGGSYHARGETIVCGAYTLGFSVNNSATSLRAMSWRQGRQIPL